MKILDLCGGTGSWSRPYKEAGYDVRLVTLPDNDVRTYVPLKNVYGVLAAPPCTVFSKAAWSIKKPERRFREGMEIVRACLNIIWEIQENGAPLKFWALENPMGYLYNFLGKPAFFFQPWQYGETGFTATKRTAIWGYFKEPAKTNVKRTLPFISPHTSRRKSPLRLFEVEYKKENKEWYSRRAADRAVTPAGFAKAFFEANR